MLASDFIGFIGSAFLLAPPLEDQWGRLREARSAKRAEGSTKFRHLWTVAAAAWKTRRDAFSGWQLLCHLIGVVALLVTFFLKMVGL